MPNKHQYITSLFIAHRTHEQSKNSRVSKKLGENGTGSGGYRSGFFLPICIQ